MVCLCECRAITDNIMLKVGISSATRALNDAIQHRIAFEERLCLECGPCQVEQTSEYACRKSEVGTI